MSDSAANAGVEDVVTSIKRLVSDRSEEGNVAEGPQPSVDKLVLTPALRIADQGEVEEEIPAADRDVRTEPDIPVDAGAERRGKGDASPVQPAFLRRDQLAAVDLEATIAELEAAVAAHEQEWEPDGSEETSDFVAAPHVLKPLAENDASDAAPVRLETPAEAPVRLETPAETPAATAAPTVPDPWVSGVPEPAPAGPDAQAPQSEPEERPAVDDNPDDLVLDETALRELVAQIVREELKGPLGERITRNVRKLVRREIFRIVEGQSRD